MLEAGGSLSVVAGIENEPQAFGINLLASKARFNITDDRIPLINGAAKREVDGWIFLLLVSISGVALKLAIDQDRCAAVRLRGELKTNLVDVHLAAILFDFKGKNVGTNYFTNGLLLLIGTIGFKKIKVAQEDAIVDHLLAVEATRQEVSIIGLGEIISRIGRQGAVVPVIGGESVVLSISVFVDKAIGEFP